MKHYVLILFAAMAAFSSCVTQKEYQELEEQKKYYETEALIADSLRNEYNKVAEENRELEIEFRNTRLDLEQFMVTNKSLQNSYLALLERVEGLKKDRNELDITASYEKYNLERQLSGQQAGTRGQPCPHRDRRADIEADFARDPAIHRSGENLAHIIRVMGEHRLIEFDWLRHDELARRNQPVLNKELRDQPVFSHRKAVSGRKVGLKIRMVQNGKRHGTLS